MVDKENTPAKELHFPAWAKWLIGAFCFIALLPFLFHAVENYRGKKEWEETKVWLEEQGESLDYQPIPVPEVPDEDNYWKQPLVRAALTFHVDGDIQLSNADPDESDRLAMLSLGSDSFDKRLPAGFSRYTCSGPDFETCLEIFKNSPDFAVPKTGTPSGRILEALNSRFDTEFKELKQAAATQHSVILSKQRENLLQQTRDYVSYSSFLDLLFFESFRFSCAANAGDETLAMDALEFPYRASVMKTNDRSMMTSMIQSSWFSIYLSMIWYGLEQKIFSPDSLNDLDSKLSKIDLPGHHLDRFRHCIWKMEIPLYGMLSDRESSEAREYADDPLTRPNISPVADQMIDLIGSPSGWWNTNRSLIAREATEHIIQPLANRDLKKLYHFPDYGSQKAYYSNYHGLTFMSVYSSTYRNIAIMAVDLELAKIAIALERYHLDHETYPETLNDLVPNYLPKIARDPFDAGAPIQYRLDIKERPVVYSVGPNGTDEDGKSHPKSRGYNPKEFKADISWHYSKDLIIE